MGRARAGQRAIMSALRVLHLTPELPFQPGAGGGRNLEFALCRALAGRGHEVVNVSPSLPHEREQAKALEGLGVAVRLALRPARPVEEVARAVAAEPAVLGAALTQPERALEMRVFWTRLRAVAFRAIDQLDPDVAVIGHDMAMAWSDDLPSDLPVVLTCHNLLWNWYESRARRTSGPAAALLRAEAWRYRRFVRSRLPRFHTAIALSTIERDQLLAIGGARVALIPMGVDTDAVEVRPEREGPPRVLFTGTMSYQPNSQGARWLAERVWPLVRRSVPDARLDIVGREPGPELWALHGRDGIAVHGFVPSMAPYFEATHVVVAPILTGAGIRVKILEALAAGRAVVSTTLGYEGLGLQAGHHLLVEDTPERFATAVVELLTDADQRTQLGRQGRDRVERDFGSHALGARLESVLSEAARGG